MHKAISSDSDSTCVWIKSINLILKARRRAEVLVIAIWNIGKIDLLVLRVDSYIVQRIELSAEEIVQKDCHSVNRMFPDTIIPGMIG